MGTDVFMRLATLEDTEAIEALMRASTAALFPRYYDARQSASAVRHVTRVDTMLIEDGTYFVLESDGELVGCGGWSRRDRLYTGSGDDEGDSRLLDPAAEPAKVRAMFVRADWTRRGLGRRIIEECEQAARREGYRGSHSWPRFPARALPRLRLRAARRGGGRAVRRRDARGRPDGEADRPAARREPARRRRRRAAHRARLVLFNSHRASSPGALRSGRRLRPQRRSPGARRRRAVAPAAARLSAPAA